MVGIFDPAYELLPPWTKEQCSVWLWGVELCCRPYSAGVLQSTSDQIQYLQNRFTTPNKLTSEDDIYGLVSLKFLRPCLQASHLYELSILKSLCPSRKLYS
jgi:hypothetical protein